MRSPILLTPFFRVSGILSGDGSRMALNGQESSHNLHWIHSSGVIEACHFVNRETILKRMLYGHRNLQYGLRLESAAVGLNIQILRELGVIEQCRCSQGQYYYEYKLTENGKKLARIIQQLERV